MTEEFEKLGVVVIGINKDSVESHLKFAIKYDLNFILLSDPEGDVVKSYDVASKLFGVSRATYIIDEKGIIIKAMPKVKADTNASEILEFLKQN